MLLFETGQKLLFLGDSVCEAGRSPQLPLGDGYARITDALLRAVYPQRRIVTQNLAVRDSALSDFDGYHVSGADHVALLIGADEIRRAFKEGFEPDPALYGDRLRAFVDRDPQQSGDIILMTPFCLHPDPEDAVRRAVEEYRREVLDVASEYMLTAVDLQTAFDRYMLHRHPLSLSDDLFCPDITGHFIIARALLSEVGFSFEGDVSQSDGLTSIPF